LTQQWTALTGAQIYSSPSVASGTIYVGSEDGHLYAYDATGTTGCSGSPKVCSPLWKGSMGSARPGHSSPAVANGTVFIGGSDGRLYAFDATGTTGCAGSPKVCAPLWSAQAGTGTVESSPAVVSGTVYVGGSGGLYAFDAAGTSGCSGTPKHCSPLWSGATTGAVISSPAVANGAVYVGDTGDGKLYAFDAAGSTGCSGTPKHCSPLWTASTGQFENVDESPAVTDKFVYVGSGAGMFVFDAAGIKDCSGTPKTCAPLGNFAGTGGALTASPAVANGVVYFATSDDFLKAYDATGKSGCSSPPITCNALFSALTDVNADSSPAIASGVVYVGDAGGTLHAFGLP
jgi:outer membrane protein assembly factor BamB